MTLPTEQELQRLREQRGDDETYHATFDAVLEDKLRELDPAWMEAMENEYKESRMGRWYA